MNDFLLLMHNDAPAPVNHAGWGSYIAGLNAGGHFDGGSTLGPGVRATKAGTSAEVTAHLDGYMRIRARDIAQATALLAGNPVFEAGGTVEIRALLRD